ncbi:MAG: ester cyclase, partial [Pseudomonadota bacterium]
RVFDAPQADRGASEAIKLAGNALRLCFADADLATLRGAYDFRVQTSFPGDVSLYGPDQLQVWFSSLLKSFPDLKISIDHVAETAYLGDATDVAIRWSATGTHSTAGRYGPASNAPIYLLGVTQFRIMNGRIREQVFIWDDIALRRQIISARY